MDEFVTMGQQGVFEPEERLELWDGIIQNMAPIGPGHNGITDQLTGLFSPLYTQQRAILRIQGSMRLSDIHAPHPDVLLLRWREDHYKARLPTPDDVHLLVEVCETSQTLDRGPKLAAYAQAGIAEYWIVDPAVGAVTVCREPAGSRYARQVDHRQGTLAPLAFPDHVIDVAAVLA